MSTASAAARIGITVNEYRARQGAGQKWCTRCRAWHLLSEFGSDSSRGSGRSASCRSTGGAFAEPAPPVVAPNRADTDLAYLAGVIDSDGYITAAAGYRVSSVSLAASVGITGTDRAPHDLACSLFGGKVNSYAVKNGQPGRRECFLWQRYGDAAVSVLESVKPYLRIKREHAELAIDLQELVVEEREMKRSDEPYPWFGPDYSPQPHMVAMAVELRSLNTRSTRSRLDDFVHAYPQAVARG